MASYGRRVRTLKGLDRVTLKVNVNKRLIANTFFKDITFYRPPDEALLPNLRELDWTAYSDATSAAVLIFISPSVKTLTIRVKDAVSPAGYKTLLRNLGGRLWGIESFTLKTALPAGTIVTELGDCIRRMEQLKSLELPQFYLYENILRAASHLRSLKSLSVSWLSQQVYDENGMQFYFQEGWFCHIRRIQVDTHPQAFAAFLSARQYSHLIERPRD